MRIISGLIIAVSLLIGAQTASATVINLNSRDRNNAVTLQLAAGEYRLTPLAAGEDGALYDAFSYWRGNSGCGAGDTCQKGYIHRFHVTADSLGTTSFGQAPYYRSAALALAAASVHSITLEVAQAVTFEIRDSVFGDNRGGISLRVDPVVAFQLNGADEGHSVPAPALALPFLLAAAKLRRR